MAEAQRVRRRSSFHGSREQKDRKNFFAGISFQASSNGRKVLVTGSVSRRVRRIVEEYAGKFNDEVKAEAVSAMQNLKVRLGTKRTEEICELGLNGNLDEAIEALLIDYYDPKYDGHIQKNAPYELTVSGDDTEEAAAALLHWSDFSAHAALKSH